MPGAPEDVNPLQDLDFGDEPMGPKSPGGAGARKAAPPSPQANAPPAATGAAPPPLPRRAPAGGPKPPAPQPSTTAGGLGAVAQVPQAMPRPSGDPFQEPPEPRPPRGIALDEKLEYFRSVLKLKEETLGRARAIYEQRDLEAARLREVAVALKAQLDEVLPQLGQLRYLPDRIAQLQAALEQERARADAGETQASTFEQQLASSDADRRDLARALAEVEAELPTAKAALDEERMGRAAVDEELTTVKESLQAAEEKARALEVEKLEALGNLDAVNGQYHEMASTADRMEADLTRLSEEVRTLTTERDASYSERDVLRNELQSLGEESKKATHALEQVRSNLGSLQGEQEWNKSSLTEAQGRVRYLEGELNEARQRAQALEEARAQMAEASARSWEARDPPSPR